MAMSKYNETRGIQYYRELKGITWGYSFRLLIDRRPGDPFRAAVIHNLISALQVKSDEVSQSSLHTIASFVNAGELNQVLSADEMAILKNTLRKSKAGAPDDISKIRSLLQAKPQP
jgi:hypothetical protein